MQFLLAFGMAMVLRKIILGTVVYPEGPRNRKRSNKTTP